MIYRIVLLVALSFPILCNASEPLGASINPKSSEGSMDKPSVALQSAQKSESPIDILFDPRDYDNDSHDSPYFWSSKSNKFYGKSVFDWTDMDFSALERKLKEHLIFLRDEAESSLSKKNLKTLDEDSSYIRHRKTIQIAIDSIPRNKMYVVLAKKELEEKEAKERAEKEKEQADRAKRDTEESQRREAMQAKIKSDETTRAAERAEREKEAADNERNSKLKFWFYAILAGLGVAWYWNKFIRLRCPNCKTTSPELLELEELESWRGTKTISERLSSGKTRSKVVGTTYAKIKRTYKCTTCGNVWDVVRKEEK